MRWLLVLMLFCGCSQFDEPHNGCLVAAVKERAVVRAERYVQPVEAHILAIYFAPPDAGHAALIFRGDTRWFAWDDAFGGRPLYFPCIHGVLPNPMTAAQAAFPSKRVEAAWWMD